MEFYGRDLHIFAEDMTCMIVISFCLIYEEKNDAVETPQPRA